MLILQPIVFYRGVLIHPSQHIPFDLAGFHLPLISHTAQCVRSGVAPFWDPYQYCGAPIHADIQAQTFYPPLWPAVLLGNAGAGRKLFLWGGVDAAAPHDSGGAVLFLALAPHGFCAIPPR